MLAFHCLQDTTYDLNPNTVISIVLKDILEDYLLMLEGQEIKYFSTI